MRSTHARHHSINVTVNPTLALPPSNKRVAVIIGSHSAKLVGVSNDRVEILATNILIPSSGEPLHLTLRDHGYLVQGPIYLTVSLPLPGVVPVVEILSLIPVEA